MKLNIIKSLCVAVAITSLGACSIDVPPPDQYSDPDAITTVEPARSLLTSCYLLYPQYQYEYSQLGNDFCLTNVSGKDVGQQNFFLWQDKELSDFATESWQAYYQCIANLDVLLQRLPNVKTETQKESTELDAITAEAKTLKAMCYFDLLRLFASAYDQKEDTLGVVIKTQVGAEMLPRASKVATVAYIRGLLTDAVAVDNHPTRNGYLSQQAATYLLAELALYEGNYAETERQAQKLIEACQDSWIAGNNISQLWGTSAYAGRIFAFYTADATYAGIQYSDTEGDYFAVNPEFSYADGDARKSWSIYPMTISGKERHLLGKYNKINKENGTSTYINRMRYAGAYYMAAEAEARQGQTGKALSTINHYLKAMGADELDTSLSGSKLINAILQEKYKEYVGEGQNFFDLKRTHHALKRYSTWGLTTRSTISVSDYRWTWPIPASEYRHNDQVEQNEGWPINRE